MERRTFLAGIGLGAAEVFYLHRAWALSTVEQVNSGANSHLTPIRFKKLDGHSSFDLFRHADFHSYFHAQFPGVTTPFDKNAALFKTVKEWIGGGKVSVAHHRYVALSGSVHRVSSFRGLLWIDATRTRNGQQPLAVLAFLTSDTANRKSSKSLWVVPNQSLTSLPASQVPHNLQLTMSRWLRSRRPLTQDGGLIRQVFFYEPEAAFSTLFPSDYGIRPYRTTSDVNAQGVAWGQAVSA